MLLKAAMIDVAKEGIEVKEKLLKKGYVEIKRDTFEQFKNMAKIYKKDTITIKSTNINLLIYELYANTIKEVNIYNDNSITKNIKKKLLKNSQN